MTFTYQNSQSLSITLRDDVRGDIFRFILIPKGEGDLPFLCLRDEIIRKEENDKALVERPILSYIDTRQAGPIV
jgi:hypothetical protein